MEQNSLCPRRMFHWSWSWPFKLMVSVENTRKGLIAMNEALKKEAEAKVTEKLV